jgi:hydrogenase maturation protease
MKSDVANVAQTIMFAKSEEASRMDCPTLLIGFGNQLRGDDGVGQRVAEVLQGTPGVEVLGLHQLTPELAEPISRAALVVFVDAAAGGRSGEVRCFPLTAAPGRPGSHECTPSGLLAMAASLFGRCPPVHMVIVGGESFEVNEQLSQVVEAAVPAAVEMVRGIILNQSKIDPELTDSHRTWAIQPA